VVRALLRSRPGGGTFHIEDVQDSVELALMRHGQHDVARAYVLYRERRAKSGAAVACGGRRRRSCMSPKRAAGRAGHGGAARAGRIFLCRPGCRRQGRAHPGETRRNLYDGVPLDEVFKAAILAARTLIEKEPAYTRATRACCCTPSAAKSSAKK
jgi:ribonucleoside-diphosphate reductase alpha chain